MRHRNEFQDNINLTGLENYLMERFEGHGNYRRRKSLARHFIQVCKTYIKHGYTDGMIQTRKTVWGIRSKMLTHDGGYRGVLSTKETYARFRLYADLGLTCPFEEGEPVSLLVPSKFIRSISHTEASTQIYQSNQKRIASLNKKQYLKERREKRKDLVSSKSMSSSAFEDELNGSVEMKNEDPPDDNNHCLVDDIINSI